MRIITIDRISSFASLHMYIKATNTEKSMLVMHYDSLNEYKLLFFVLYVIRLNSHYISYQVILSNYLTMFVFNGITLQWVMQIQLCFLITAPCSVLYLRR